MYTTAVSQYRDGQPIISTANPSISKDCLAERATVVVICHTQVGLEFLEDTLLEAVVHAMQAEGRADV